VRALGGENFGDAFAGAASLGGRRCLLGLDRDLDVAEGDALDGLVLERLLTVEGGLEG
jgi:hypothetical protein